MIVSQIQALASTTCLPWPNQLKRATSCSVLKHKPTSIGRSDLPSHFNTACAPYSSRQHDYNTYEGLLGAMLVEGAR